MIRKFIKQNNAIEIIGLLKPKTEFDKFEWIIVNNDIK